MKVTRTISTEGLKANLTLQLIDELVVEVAIVLFKQLNRCHVFKSAPTSDGQNFFELDVGIYALERIRIWLPVAVTKKLR